MAMHRESDAIDAPHVLAKVAEQLGKLIGNGVTDGVRNVHRGRPGFDHRLYDLSEELQLSA